MEPQANPVLDRALWLACVLTIALAALACLPSLTIPIGLLAEGDALDYRIPVLKWVARHHAYPHWPWTYVDDYPMLGELLMFPFFLVKTQFARVIPILAYFACALFTGLIGAELSPAATPERKKELTLFFTASVLGFQPLLVQACHVMADNVANACALGALLFALRRRAVPCGLWLAAALSARYTVWGAAPGAMLAFLLAARGDKGKWKGAAVIAGLGALGAAPFVVRNLLLNGNPVYPLLDGFFHGVPFTAPDGWGRGTGLGAMLLFPYDLFYTHTFVTELFDTRIYPEGWFTYRLGFLTYAQLFLAACALYATRTTLLPSLQHAARDRRVQGALAFFAAIFLFWWYGSQILRYFGYGLALINLAILLPLPARLPKGLLAAVALLPLASIGAVQAESWKIAFKAQEAYRDSAYAQSAFDCFARAGVTKQAVVGWSSRDALNGFFDNDFVFLPPNNLYRQVPGTEPPRPDFIYSGIDFHDVPGYRRWPEQKPCLLKRSDLP